jgi:hypothetical protein
MVAFEAASASNPARESSWAWYEAAYGKRIGRR